MRAQRNASNVNWRKLLADLRSAYQVRNPCEVLISELLANSIDASASKVTIELEGLCPKVLRISDNGKGMTEKDFIDYHNLASVKKRKGPGIGWAGIGAKLYIDRAREVYTETCSDSFAGASRWAFPKTDQYPTWRHVVSRRLCPRGRGTVVEVVICEKKDCGRLSEETIEETVLSNFNYALLPTGTIVVTINGRRVRPFVPQEDADNRCEVDIRLKKGAHVTGVFSKLREPAPRGFSLISVIVHGKTVDNQYDFRQFGRIKDPDLISGYVRCDELIQVVTTSKDSFQRKTSEWQDFNNKVGKEFSAWLKSIGGVVSAEIDKELNDIAQQVQQELNRIFRLPEIRALHLDLFQDTSRRQTLLPDPKGEVNASEFNGQQMVGGTLGGSGASNLMPVEGDESGKAMAEQPEGDMKATQKMRQSRGGIKIVYDSLPDKPERAWIDPGCQAVLINRGNPAFKCARIHGSTSYYLIDECLNIICDSIESEDDRKETLNKLLGAYLDTRTRGDGVAA